MTQNRHANTRPHDRYDGLAEPAVRLGDTVRDVLQNQISPRQQKFSSIVTCWQQLVPAELARHCTIAGIRAGRLKVRVDAPAYIYELQLRKADLLRELQQRCPRGRLQKIDLALG